MEFEEKYFKELKFSKDQIAGCLNNALRDLDIAKSDKILEVKFNYSYTALIKSGITLLMVRNKKVRSAPGHHMMIIEKMSKILSDDSIEVIGNAMRTKRNIDLYAGGIEISEKECKEYLEFVREVIEKVKNDVKSGHFLDTKRFPSNKI